VGAPPGHLVSVRELSRAHGAPLHSGHADLFAQLLDFQRGRLVQPLVTPAWTNLFQYVPHTFNVPLLVAAATWGMNSANVGMVGRSVSVADSRSAGVTPSLEINSRARSLSLDPVQGAAVRR
jgi:hypothetical protein